MTKQRILHATSALAAGLIIATGVGVVGAHASEGDNGGHHNSKGSDTSIKNDNDVTVNNTTSQVANSGDATVDPGNNKDGGDKHHHHESSDPVVGGDATTGDASNSSTSNVSVSIDNGSCGCATTPATEGEGGNKLTVNNDNDVVVNNTTSQVATSGDAKVKGGSGNATTGDASNMSDSTVTVSITN
ncbi:MAG TPA: hypothetical protein VLF39_03070 [Candidatus Saccharimonadales bacterium]|nr:hypothetical protein [Candidatus Saccharimonadales bacterium]